MSEHWPPEWGEEDDEDLGIEQSDTGRLAEVTSALASMPMPALPDTFAARISAAIAAESAARTQLATAAGGSATARSLVPESSLPAAADRPAATAPPARSRRAGARGGSRRPGTPRAPGPAGRPPRRRWLRGLASAPVVGSLVVCLVIAGLGFLIVRGPSSSSSSSAESAPAGPVAGAGGALAGAASAAASASASAAGPRQTQAAGSSAQSSGLRFGIRETGTRYEPSTLARQVRAVIDSTAAHSSSPAVNPAMSAAAGTRAPAAPPLAGCVLGLTGGVTPSLVDRARYAGQPAYVIAVPRRAWVVRLGCTAAHPELITTVVLARLSGNLCALISVERRAILKKGACSDRRT